MNEPFVSVLIPVRDEERYIERCLESLGTQDYPRRRFEVLVIDGHSTDGTKQLIARFAAESTLDLRLLENPALKPAFALNIGLVEARGDVIVRVDGHAAVAADYLSASVAALDATGADCVGGVITSEGDSYAGRAIALAMASRFGVGGASFRIGGEGPVDTVAFGAYRRDVFERIGTFAEDIDKGEDDEFNYRLLDAGGTIFLAPSIRARYTVRGSIVGLWRQYFGYGRAKPEVLRRHPSQVRPRQLVPPLFVAGLVVAALRAAGGDARPLKALLATYVAAIGAASAAVALPRAPRQLPLLPIVFACLHVAYGAGFLVGLGRAGLRIVGGTPVVDRSRISPGDFEMRG